MMTGSFPILRGFVRVRKTDAPFHNSAVRANAGQVDVVMIQSSNYDPVGWYKKLALNASPREVIACYRETVQAGGVIPLRRSFDRTIAPHLPRPRPDETLVTAGPAQRCEITVPRTNSAGLILAIKNAGSRFPASRIRIAPPLISWNFMRDEAGKTYSLVIRRPRPGIALRDFMDLCRFDGLSGNNAVLAAWVAAAKPPEGKYVTVPDDERQWKAPVNGKPHLLCYERLTRPLPVHQMYLRFAQCDWDNGFNVVMCREISRR
jgi:hypothetical protein